MDGYIYKFWAYIGVYLRQNMSNIIVTLFMQQIGNRFDYLKDNLKMITKNFVLKDSFAIVDK